MPLFFNFVPVLPVFHVVRWVFSLTVYTCIDLFFYATSTSHESPIPLLRGACFPWCVSLVVLVLASFGWCDSFRVLHLFGFLYLFGLLCFSWCFSWCAWLPLCLRHNLKNCPAFMPSAQFKKLPCLYSFRWLYVIRLALCDSLGFLPFIFLRCFSWCFCSLYLFGCLWLFYPFG